MKRSEIKGLFLVAVAELVTDEVIGLVARLDAVMSDGAVVDLAPLLLQQLVGNDLGGLRRLVEAAEASRARRDRFATSGEIVVEHDVRERDRQRRRDSFARRVRGGQA